jgi:Protein of unknown function (DUF2950)
MTSLSKERGTTLTIVAISLLLIAAVWVISGCDKPQAPAQATRQDAPATFQTPQEAAGALAKAAGNHDQPGISRILGPESQSLLSSGDASIDKAANADFAAKYDQMNRWVDMTDGTKVLYVGADNFAFPIPLANNSSGKWFFDSRAGADEIRARDLGRNELLAIDACNAIANAEELFFKKNHEYAQRVMSTPGKQDGVHWSVAETEESSPLGHLKKFPKGAIATPDGNEPPTIDGYTLRILTAQGDEAKGGAKSYIVNGKMTRGFAVLATPEKYGKTGIMTFVLSREGTVYEQDLGPKTFEIAAFIKEYNPTQGWSPADRMGK